MASSKLHQIYQEINTNNIDAAETMIESINPSTISVSDLRGYYTLRIRIMISRKQTEDLLEFFKTTKNLMSRDYINLVDYLNKISSLSAQIYFRESVMNSTIFKSKDIDKLIDINNKAILKYLVGSFNRTTRKGVIKEVGDILFEDNIINPIVNSVKQKARKNIIDKIKGFSYKIVIDGGNVLHSYQGKLNDKSFRNLKNMMDQVVEPFLLILHLRHKKKYLKIIGGDYPVVFTPFKSNDDIYIIMASLINQSKIITNDNFGDHNAIYSNSNNYLRYYFDEKIINYSFDKKYSFSIPKYSMVRLVDGKIMIPSEKKGFYIID